MARCHHCKEHVTPRRDRDRYFIQDAKERIWEGEDADVVRRDLLDYGFLDDEVDAILRSGREALRLDNQEEGCRQLAKGIMLLFVGGVILLVAVGAEMVNVLKFGWVLFLLIGGGLIATFFGLRAIFTGR